jgi:hypothetical protein
MAVNRNAIIVTERFNEKTGQWITLESVDGSYRNNGEQRDPKLCICSQEGYRTSSVMLTHNENLQQLWWYRNNDSEWNLLKPQIRAILDDERLEQCPQFKEHRTYAR